MTASIGRLNVRRKLALGATALAMTSGVAGIAASAADAANATLAPRQSANFPTWGFQQTTICVDNLSDGDGYATFAAAGSSADTRYVAPHSEYCMTRLWWGFNVNVKNISQNATFRVFNQHGPN